MKNPIKNINALYQGEFPPIDEVVAILEDYGAEPEYWGVRPTDDDPVGVDRPYVYFLARDQTVAFQIHQLTELAVCDGFFWSLSAFFPGEAGLKTTSRDRRLGDLRYCLELRWVPNATTSRCGWLEYRNQASSFLIQSLKENLGLGGTKSGESGGIALAR